MLVKYNFISRVIDSSLPGPLKTHMSNLITGIHRRLQEIADDTVVETNQILEFDESNKSQTIYNQTDWQSTTT